MDPRMVREGRGDSKTHSDREKTESLGDPICARSLLTYRGEEEGEEGALFLRLDEGRVNQGEPVVTAKKSIFWRV